MKQNSSSGVGLKTELINSKKETVRPKTIYLKPLIVWIVFDQQTKDQTKIQFNISDVTLVRQPRAANSVDFFIEFKFEFEFSLFYEFKFKFSIFIFASSSSSSSPVKIYQVFLSLEKSDYLEHGASRF